MFQAFVLVYGFVLPFPQLIMLSAQTGYINSWLTSTSTLVRVRTWRAPRYSHVAPRVFQFAVVFCAQCLKSCFCAAESREYIYITYYGILIFSYRLFGMCSRLSLTMVPFTRRAGCTFRLNGRKRVIRHSA